MKFRCFSCRLNIIILAVSLATRHLLTTLQFHVMHFSFDISLYFVVVVVFFVHIPDWQAFFSLDLDMDICCCWCCFDDIFLKPSETILELGCTRNIYYNTRRSCTSMVPSWAKGEFHSACGTTKRHCWFCAC